MTRLDVHASSGAYPVIVEAGILDAIPDHVPTPARVERVAIVADAHTAALFGGPLRDSYPGAEWFTLEPGEASKSTVALEALWRWLAAEGMHRGDLLVAVGGGVVTDLAGFAAATYHRGMAWLAVPTTLLAMVDAAIGGKTAIDLPEGKNLAGSFHPPIGVVADPVALATLPDRELRTGLAEVIKHGFITPGTLLDEVIGAHAQIEARDPATLVAIISDAAAVKVAVVSEDETERGARAHLNYGHTLAHAIETVEGYAGRSHGEAVAVGLAFAARLSKALGLHDLVEHHEAALTAVGLSVAPPGIDADLLIQAMGRDKKYDHGLRFVVLEELGKPTVVTVEPSLIDETLRAWQ